MFHFKLEELYSMVGKKLSIKQQNIELFIATEKIMFYVITIFNTSLKHILSKEHIILYTRAEMKTF